MLQSVYYDVAQTGLKPLSGLTEIYIPLWVYSSGRAQSSMTSGPWGAMLQKGSTATLSSGTDTQIKLHTLSSGWSASQKFAFECSFYTAAFTGTVALNDITTGTEVGGARISTTSTTATVVRSGAFTLVPGHVYGVDIWVQGGASTMWLTKAHLIALM